MRLRNKVILTIIPLTLAFLLIANQIAYNYIVEKANAEDGVLAEEFAQRIDSGMTHMVYDLDVSCSEWGRSDSVWDYLQHGNRSFLDEHMNLNTLVSLNIDQVSIFDANGSLLDGIAIEIGDGSVGAVPGDLLQLISDDPTLVVHPNSTAYRSGLLTLGDDHMLFSSRPVIGVDAVAPVGAVLVGRYVDQAIIDELCDIYDIGSGGLAIAVPDHTGDGKMTITNLDETVYHWSRNLRGPCT
jgi:sensor domain CHASE-containing protein